MQQIDYSELLVGIDHGIDAHLAWNQRLFRCAVLRESPGNDVLLPNAHELCQFGIWFNKQREIFNVIAPELVENIDHAHHLMHDGVRSLATAILKNIPASPDDLEMYQEQQSKMVMLLHTLHQRIVDIDTHYDHLTGLPMRHGLEHAFNIRTNDAIRNDKKLWIALADIDNFKLVNDTHGHSVGDSAIKHVAECISQCLRANDILFRYGGEEFLILLLGESGNGIEDVASRILSSAQTPLLLEDGQSLSLTVTIGLTQVKSAENLKTVIDRADFALFDGKKAGRNRYVFTAG